MTQLEADIWIQNMENHFGSNLISRKISGAETWDEFKKTLLRSRVIQKCYDNPKEKTCACKIYGEIGHTQEEHKHGCTHCEENHLAEECPSSQVTCFLCDGTTHFPAQCYIYPKVEQVVQQQKEAMKETLKKKILEEPVMNENIEDPDGQGLTRFFSNACYSCGEEGHYSQDCTKRSQEYLGNFPTEEVEFDPLEIEELAKIKESGKKNKYPRKSQISADIDLSHVRCYKSAMKAIRQIGEILEARLRHTQEYLSEVHAEMMEMKLMTTMMKRKMDDFKEHLGKFEWN
ncbi:hypothetical protein D1007_02118 [Hordeum vulgare]|nr:hypothetical protein D1007_52002 [Hordeum vulgare]KAE8819940.1 hypothetical protein D1007_02118 [Hordeum vulgare]